MTKQTIWNWRVKERISISALVGIITFILTAIYCTFNNEIYFGNAAVILVSLNTIMIAIMLSCKSSLCICIAGLMAHPYFASQKMAWNLILTKKELQFTGALIGLSAISFFLLTTYFDQEYPEIILRVVGLYIVTITFSILQTKLAQE
jgi:hypothetical protein